MSVLLPKKASTWMKVIAGIVFLAVTFFVFCVRDQPDSEWLIMDHEETAIEEIIEVTEYPKEPETIIVEIAGEVNRPFVFELDEKSRVIDGIEAAGGLTERADTRNMNLAYLLVDGMKIYVPSIEEIEREEKETGRKAGSEFVKGSTVLHANQVVLQEEKININNAGLEALQTLNGVGPATAEKIIAYRTTNGKFETIEDLQKVSGIGPKTFEKLKDGITVE